MKKWIVWLPLGVLVFLVSCSKDTRDNYYDERYRPQFHFTPESGWMNDPNGMVYFDGEYHLFYQYYPDSTVWGPMHWGHAISKDLVEWEHLPIALYPDSLGYIFSGSAVVDSENTSGFGEKGQSPMVAIFTYHQMEMEQSGRTDYQYQGIAYSLDKGRTWTKYSGNPVLPNQGTNDFRDPKVFWHEPTQQWVMVLAVKDHVEFYGSANLKEWGFLSDYGRDIGAHGGVWECPDLFKLTTDKGVEKWVLLVSINPGGPNGGSATQYFLGTFDGEIFKEDVGTENNWLDWGSDNYAGVTWYNAPEQQRLFIGWMSNWDYATLVPSEGWRSAMTLPRTLHLVHSNESWILASKPIESLKMLLTDTKVINEQVYFGYSYWTEYLQSPTYLLDFEFRPTEQGQDWVIDLYNHLDEHVLIGYDFHTREFSIDRSESYQQAFSEKFNKRHQATYASTNDVLKVQIWVDASSIEVFVNEGELVMTDLYFSTVPLNQIKFDTKDQALLVKGTISSVSSIWR